MLEDFNKKGVGALKSHFTEHAKFHGSLLLCCQWIFQATSLNIPHTLGKKNSFTTAELSPILEIHGCVYVPVAGLFLFVCFCMSLLTKLPEALLFLFCFVYLVEARMRANTQCTSTGA